jgi:hypothetical protein
MGRVALASLICLAASSAFSQTLEPGVNSTTRGSDATMAQLFSKGYEIKSAVPNGSKLIVFMQKGTSGYACDFVNVTKTRCALIN